MREKAKWLTQVSLVLALLGCAGSDVTPAEQKLADELPTWYAKAQAAGIPLTLAEAGVARIAHPLWPESAVRYTAEGSVVQLWSVGLNGVDDQGSKDDRRIVWRLPAASSLP